MKCRFCETELQYLFLSLGPSPLSNNYLSREQLNKYEPFYPLDTYICHKCLLVQLDIFETPEKIFGDYAYYSSFSDTWLHHAREYTDRIINRYNINGNSLVVEIASNDGYLLQFFIAKNIPVLGIEPAKNVAEAAIAKGIPTEIAFFGASAAGRYAGMGKKADLVVANNVLAHVPDLHDFVDGLRIILKDTGIITLEFPYLPKMIEEGQFDTIYHEHFSYFSFLTADNIFSSHSLRIFDVEELPTHGGSLRIYVCHGDDHTKATSDNVHLLKDREKERGYATLSSYLNVHERVKGLKRAILKLLISIKEENKSIAGYGAPAKGNTLLNFCGIKGDFIDYTVDKNPYKQGRYLPGSRIPIKPVEELNRTKPDYILVLPWNIKDEVIGQIRFVREWGGKFIIPIPTPTVV